MTLGAHRVVPNPFNSRSKTGEKAMNAHKHAEVIKAWAKRIMYREERGDKDLMPIQVQFAKQAMNVEAQPT